MRLLHFLFGGLGTDWVRSLDSTSPMGIHPNGISTSLMSRRRSLPRIKLRLLKVFCSIMVAGMRVSGVYSIKSFVFLHAMVMAGLYVRLETCLPRRKMEM